MKKKVSLILLVFSIFMIIPISASAATTADVTLSCTSAVEKGATVTCTVIADLTSGGLTQLSGTISADSDYFTVSDTTFLETGAWTEGDNRTIGTFTVVAKSAVGTGTIELNSIVGIFDDDPEQFVIISDTSISDGTRVMDDDASLKNIKIDGTTITGFVSTTFTYAKNISKSTMALTAEKNSATAVVTGTGTKSLSCGINTFKIYVTAENGDKNTYTLNMTRLCNDSTVLAGITLSSGSLTPAFNTTSKAYTVSVSKDIEKITVNGTKAYTAQAISGGVTDKALVYGDNIIKLIVTAENGDKDTYTVTVNREDGRSTNTYLSSLTLSDGALAFIKDTYEYTSRVLFSTTQVTVTALPEATTSKVVVTGGTNLVVGANTIKIKVTAENETFKEYTIILTRLAEGETLGNNTNIKTLDIEGYKIDFDNDTKSYDLKIKNETSLVFDITMEDQTTNYSVEGNKNLKNGSVITINVVASDGTTKEYEINIIKSNLLLYGIIGGSVLILGLATLLIVKNKEKLFTKHEKTIKTEKIKIKKSKLNTKDDDLMDKVTNQLNQIEKDVNTEITSDSEKISSLERTIVIDKPAVSDSQSDIDEAGLDETTEMSTQELTKVCSICGHRIPASSAICPYCKKKF